MRHSAKVTGAKELARLFRSHPARVQRETESILRQAGRGLAIEYGLATNPPNAGGEAAVGAFKERIADEIRTVYPTRDDHAKVYRMMQKHAPHLAKAYWNAFKSQKPTKMAAILRQASLPQGGANTGQLKSWRTGRRGRVDKRKGAAALVRAHEQRKIIKNHQDLVGVGKAGWHQSAKAIGGRVRRNLQDASGKRTTVEAFPGYVRKVSRKFSGLGGAMVHADRITIFSNVRHAVEALDPRKKLQAEAEAEANFQKAMAFALSAVNEKYFGKAA